MTFRLLGVDMNLLVRVCELKSAFIESGTLSCMEAISWLSGRYELINFDGSLVLDRDRGMLMHSFGPLILNDANFDTCVCRHITATAATGSRFLTIIDRCSSSTRSSGTPWCAACFLV